VQAPLNLIGLMPRLHELRVYDNSAEADARLVADGPRLLLHVQRGAVQFPQALADLRQTPDWAKPIVQAARQLGRH
jgi:hypothetical protein